MSDLTADQAIDAAMDSAPAAPAPSDSGHTIPANPTQNDAPAAVSSDAGHTKPTDSALPAGDDDLADVPRSPAPKTEPAPPPQKSQPKPPDAKDPILESKNIKEIRSAYEARKQELTQARAEAAKWQKDFNDAKKAGYTEAESKYKADLETERKRSKELDDQVKYTAFERSSEFKEKYQKPISEAWTKTMDDLKGVKILDSNGSETEEVATPQHVVQLCHMSGIQAAKQAKAWFGDAATEVLAHRRAIIELNQKKDSAIKEWNEKGSEMTAAKEREEEGRQAEITKHFDSSLERFTGVIPGFKPPEDAEALNFYKAGVATVAMALKGDGMPAGLTPQQQTQRRVEAQAKMAAKSIAYGPIAHENMKLKSQIQALETQLAGYKKSTPKPTADPHQPSSGHVETVDDIIDNIPGLRG